MNTNSFQLKSMSVAITSGLLAITAAGDFEALYPSIISLSLIVFWVLDAYYLSMEKAYRRLYDDVRQKNENMIDFNLSISDAHKRKCEWFYTLFNKTVYLFYILQALISAILVLLFQV